MRILQCNYRISSPFGPSQYQIDIVSVSQQCHPSFEIEMLIWLQYDLIDLNLINLLQSLNVGQFQTKYLQVINIVVVVIYM